LKAAAHTFRQKYPAINITIAADNDHRTPGNPGLTKGEEARALVGGEIIWPDFSEMDRSGTDFNDYVIAGGAI